MYWSHLPNPEPKFFFNNHRYCEPKVKNDCFEFCILSAGKRLEWGSPSLVFQLD
jgi:hypothetical protein